MNCLYLVTSAWTGNGQSLVRSGLVEDVSSAKAASAHVRKVSGELPTCSMIGQPLVSDVTHSARQFVAENPA